jgi:hypothetical protein
MGIVSLFSKSAPTLTRLPSGSFTVDRHGRVLIGTVPSSFPAELVAEIGTKIVATFREAQEAQLPLSELTLHFTSLKITARELRGGAIVFLKPQTPVSATPTT